MYYHCFWYYYYYCDYYCQAKNVSHVPIPTKNTHAESAFTKKITKPLAVMAIDYTVLPLA